MTASIKTEDAVSGEAIILDFKAGKAAGIATYEKLCKAVDLIGRWQPDAVTHFIDQFVDIPHLLDASCKLLVKKLARIEWHIIPSHSRERFVNLLREVGIQHVCHTETVIACFMEHFAAKIRLNTTNDEDVANESASQRSQKFELVLNADEQKTIFSLAHQSLAFVLKCFPMAVKLLPKLVRRSYPHFSQPFLRYESFVRNALILSEYASDVRVEIWSVIFDGLAQIDAMISKRIESHVIPEDNEDSNDSSGVFLLDEEDDPLRIGILREDERSKDRIDKLDICLGYIFSYITKAHNKELPSEIGELIDWLPKQSSHDELDMQLRSIFEEHILMAHDVKHVSFVWLVSCSHEPEYMAEMLRWLWSLITRPGQSPNDWKKAQGAACYMGAFLSRAVTVDLSMSLEWMERMMHLCRNYINEVVDRSNSATAGIIRHGTFYALCQALLLTFCFRYKELVDTNELEAVRQWGFGHIVHSALEPLRFISRPVAQCFAIISRSLQLVYCNHVLPMASAEEKLPFEPLFPFDSFLLTQSSIFVRPLLRRFSPLAEDVGVLKRELRWHQATTLSGAMGFKSSDEAAGSLDFLDDLARDRDLLSESLTAAGALSAASQSKVFTVYSASPGLCHFDGVSSLMDMN